MVFLCFKKFNHINNKMKSKITQLTMIMLLLMLPQLSKAVTVTDTALATNVQTCLKPEIVRLQFSISGTGTTGSYLEVKLPTGFTWEGLAYFTVVSGGANSATYAGLQSNGRHRITFANSTASSVLRMGFRQKATCGSGSSSFTALDSLFFYEGTGSMNLSATNSFNGNAPDLSLTGVSNSPSPANVGATVTRVMTITNGGLGATSNIIAVDAFSSGALGFVTGSGRINPSGVNYTIPNGQITVKADSFIFRLTATQIQQIGDGDTLFENGESFVLRYQIVPQNCGVGFSISSNLLVKWGCNNNFCQTTSAIAGLGISAPASPNLVFSRIQQALKCYGNLQQDTAIYRNTGGPATNVNISTYQGYPGVGYSPTGLRNIDTSALRYKIGRNGSWVKPSAFSNIATTGSAFGCGATIARVNFIVPVLAAGDTLYVLTTSTTCNVDFVANRGCTQSTYSAPRMPVIDQNLTYRDGCNSITFTSTLNTIRDYGLWDAQTTNNTPGSITGGTTSTFKYTFNQSGHSPASVRQKMRITFTPPAGFTIDNSSGSGVIVKIGATTYNPSSYNSGTNEYFFNGVPASSQGGAVMEVKVAAPACGSCAAGYLDFNWESAYQLDSSLGCNYNKNNCNTARFYYNCPPCCPLGIVKLDSFKSMRKNYGLPDNNNDGQPDGSGIIDMSKVDTKNTANADTAIITWYGIVNAATSGPHTQFPYVFASFYTPSSFFTNYTNLGATVYVDRASLPDTSWTVGNGTRSGADTLRFNLSYSRPYKDGDKIRLELLLRNSIGYANGYASNSWSLTPAMYGSQLANPVSADTSVRRTCGAGLDYLGVKIARTVINPQNPTAQFVGCNQVVLLPIVYQTYENSTANTQNMWEYEYKPLTYPKQYKWLPPIGYSVDSVRAQFRYHTTTSSSATVNLGTIPHTISNDTLIVNVGSRFTPDGGSLLPGDDGYTFDLFVHTKSSCQVSNLITLNGRFASGTLGGVVSTLTNIAPTYTISGPSHHIMRSTLPQLLINSSNPTQNVYTNIVQWPLAVREAAGIASPLTWVSFVSNSGLVQVDSLKLGSTVILADANGFFRLGNLNNTTNNYTVFARHTVCGTDSIQVYYGFSCSAYPSVPFNTTICSYSPINLRLATQPSAIQTAITALASTPSDPSNASSTAYSLSTVNMCQSFPVEIEIQSTQASNIFNVKEILNLPIGLNGNTALDYVSDSGYIEYPIGSTPRRFSSAANTAILAEISTGKITLDLNQIDPDSFSTSKGLKGTALGTNATRRVILRLKMRPNCDLISGDQWTATQRALSACGAGAIGDNTPVSGFVLNVSGVSRPYLADVVITSGRVEGCGGTAPVRIRLEKVGASSPTPTDSLTLRIPKSVKSGTITCNGAFCPSGTVTPVETIIGNFKYLKWQYPSTAGNGGDTLLYTYSMSADDKASCATGEQVKVDVLQKITITCGAGTCPNATVSLGGSQRPFDVVKANLIFDAYSSTYVYPSFYKYVFGGNVLNTSTYVAAGTGVTLKTFMDVNNNLTYEKGIDALVKTTVLGSSIPTSGSVSFMDSFENNLYPPSPSLPMYTVIDTGDASANCFCGGVVQSAFNQALPIEFLSVKATNLNNLNGKVQWVTNADKFTLRFDIYRRTENEATFTKIGYVMAQNGLNQQAQYVYYDPISSLSEGRIYYQIEAVSLNNINKLSQVVSIQKTGLITDNSLFSISPNPSTNHVKITLSEGLINGEVTITDLNGKVVYQSKFNGVETAIKTSEYTAGVYTVRIKSSESIETQKLSIIK